jgi:1,4-dihydroxy-2-naphthoyl-CoA hydrolase
MAFHDRYRIQFRDTDAAGVVFFANVLAICHAAYEASLQSAGVDLQQFFQPYDVAVPVAHADCKFLRPMRCGEHYDIALTPALIAASELSVCYQWRQVDADSAALAATA